MEVVYCPDENGRIYVLVRYYIARWERPPLFVGISTIVRNSYGSRTHFSSNKRRTKPRTIDVILSSQYKSNNNNKVPVYSVSYLC